MSSRRRPALSCSLCRKRKIKCNREHPCSNCVRLNNEHCIYDHHPPLRRRDDGISRPGIGAGTDGLYSNIARIQQPHRPEIPDTASRPSRGSATPSSNLTLFPSGSSPAGASTNTSSNPSQASSQDVNFMRTRIKDLEYQLLRATKSLNARSYAPVTTGVHDTEGPFSRPSPAESHSVVHDSHLFGKSEFVFGSGLIHKSRLFGQTHWGNTMTGLQEIFEILGSDMRSPTSKAATNMQRCKMLARAIKSQRIPRWPALPSAELPDKAMADGLIDCYLQTVETVYRILHVPTFKRNYEALWENDSNSTDTAFVVQVKLVLVIGATMHDDTFSLRSLATQWVSEALMWKSMPEFKSRLTIQMLQTDLLLLLARERVGLGTDFIWVSIGELYRTAVLMGLHRDPQHLTDITVFAAEMRRRLWNTILELSLQFSVTGGTPPLIYLSEFDTQPPQNLDDNQLSPGESSVVPKHNNEFTDMSVALALQKTFSIRLAIVKICNDNGHGCTYDEALQLDMQLRNSIRSLYRAFGAFKSCSNGPSRFTTNMVNFIIHRYLIAIHAPFFISASQEAKYSFSRTIVIDTSLKMWCLAYPQSSIMLSLAVDSPSQGIEHDDLLFKRFALCGVSFFREAALQSVMLITIELHDQAQQHREEGSLAPAVPLLRQDLLAVLHEAKTWSLRGIEAGETNVKAYVVNSMTAAYIDATRRNLTRGEMADYLLKEIEESEEKCIEILEEKLAKGQGKEGTGYDLDLDLEGLHFPTATTQDWDYVMGDGLLDFGFSDSTNWGYEENITIG